MNLKSRTTNSIRNILAGFVGQALVLGIGFVNRLVFIRCLTAEYLGINGLFTNILSMLSLAELGIGTAIIYALYKPLAEHDEDKIAALMQFYAKAYNFIGCIVGIVGLSLLPFLSRLVGEVPEIQENLYVIYLFYLFNTVISYFFTYKSSILIADQKNYIVTITNSIVVIVQCVIQCGVLIVTRDYILYLFCQAIGIIIYNLAISRISDREYPFIRNNKDKKLNAEDKRHLFVNVKALIITKVGGILVNSTDNIIITALQGVELTGLNSNYTLLTNTLNSILTVIFTGMTASIGNANAVEDRKSNVKLFKTVNLLNFWLYGWCSISFIVLSNDIVRICFGERYLLPMNIVIIMAINFYTVGMQNAVLTFFSTMGLFNHGKYLVLVTGGINIVLSICWGQKWGLFGILLATLISRLVTNIWYNPYAVFRYGFSEKSKSYFIRYLMYAVLLFFTLILTFWVSNILQGESIGVFGFRLIVCIFTPNIVFWLFFYKSEEFKLIYGKIVQAVVSRKFGYKK